MMDTVNSLKIITNSIIEEVLDYGSLINGLEEAFGKHSSHNDEIHQPDRCWVYAKEHHGAMGSMPVGCNYSNILATKLVTYYPHNTEEPTHNAIILTFDARNGKPIAILDGEIITEKRTAAASAVATKHLVNGEPKVLAILGSGVQAKGHYEALSHLYTFEQVRIWGRTKSKAERLAKEIGSIAQACDNAQEAVKDADVIVTATLSSTPVLMLDWVKKGAHINAVGGIQPNMAELDAELMRSSVVYADTLSGVMKDSGDQILSGAPIFAELGEVINGVKEARRSETTIFNSVGMAVEDAVAAKIVLDKMESR